MTGALILLGTLIPLLNFLVILIIGRHLGHKGSSVVSTVNMFLAFIIGVYFFFFELGDSSLILVKLFPWFIVGDLHVHFEFYLDYISIIMYLVVTLISSFVHLYSVSYMSGDPYKSNFLSYLSLFTFFMLILVTAGNFFQLFLGWEGVGLCSFLLISFWSDRVYAVGSAVKAILINRIGDIGLLLAIVFIYIEMGTLDYVTVFSLSTNFLKTYSLLGYECDYYSIVSMCLFLAAVGKSSQYLLHGWLPDAMEGPTPVSALIHAATMVTAGVFLLIRCSPIFLNSPRVLCLVAIIGFLTSVFGAFTGSRVYDLKKMIAYSTTSHLGYMFMACGMLSTSIAMFHLVVHAFFKALLFLSAGSIIHAYNNEQDVRKMAGIDIYIPITIMSLIIGSATMNGVFGLSGAISKDYILFVNFFGNSYMNFVGFGFLLLSIFFGAMYAARICSFFFFSIYGGSRTVVKGVHESDFLILIPLILLSFFSVYIGFFLENVFKDEFSSIWFGGKSILYNNYALSFGEYNENSLFFKNFGTILSDEEICLLIENVAAFGTFFSIYLYKMRQINIYMNFKNVFVLRDYFYYLYNYTEKKSMTDRIYNKVFAYMEFRNAKVFFFDFFERGFLEVVGPKGLGMFVNNFSFLSKRLTTGFVHNYLFFSLLFFLVIFMTNFFGIYISVYFVISFFFLISKSKVIK